MSGWIKKLFSRRKPIRILLEDHLRAIDAPANLRINDQIRAYREHCRKIGCERPYHHFAFGQSPFPPPPPVVAALRAHAAEHDYLPTAGLPALRQAVAEFHRRHFGLRCTADQVVVSPGSKEMIAMILSVLQGAVIIPTPSWVSYLPQAKILRKRVLSLRTRAEDHYKLTPDRLEACLGREPTEQKILILNHPNNPTGAIYDRAELEALAAVCRKNGVVVIADEIYALTSFDAKRFTSMGPIYPEGTIVTGGLSKDRSAGGYRLGVGLFPEQPQGLRDDILKLAGSTYSCVAAPIQHAARVAYSGDPEVENHIADCAAINAAVGRWFTALLADLDGVRTSSPGGGFYLLLDLNDFGDSLRRIGLATAADLARDLLKVEHTALLPGDALLLPPGDFLYRCSFVDYDGAAALAAWRSGRPTTPERRRDFLERHCPLLPAGVEALGRYLDAIRAGRRPEHVK